LRYKVKLNLNPFKNRKPCRRSGLAPIEADILVAKVGCISLVLRGAQSQATRQTLAHRPT